MKWFIRNPKTGGVRGPFGGNELRKFKAAGRLRDEYELSSDQVKWTVVSKFKWSHPALGRHEQSTAEGDTSGTTTSVTEAKSQSETPLGEALRSTVNDSSDEMLPRGNFLWIAVLVAIALAVGALDGFHRATKFPGRSGVSQLAVAGAGFGVFGALIGAWFGAVIPFGGWGEHRRIALGFAFVALSLSVKAYVDYWSVQSNLQGEINWRRRSAQHAARQPDVLSVGLNLKHVNERHDRVRDLHWHEMISRLCLWIPVSMILVLFVGVSLIAAPKLTVENPER